MKNIIENNTIVMNGDGLRIYKMSNKNIISGNNISKNHQGISIDQSKKNLLFFNNIIDNKFQAIDLTSSNYWHNETISRGNYWSDYTGLDENNDGIGDEPYEIDSNSIDHNPLMDPWVGSIDLEDETSLEDNESTNSFSIILIIVLTPILILIIYLVYKKRPRS